MEAAAAGEWGLSYVDNRTREVMGSGVLGGGLATFVAGGRVFQRACGGGEAGVWAVEGWVGGRGGGGRAVGMVVGWCG